jgi:hypothetical protein
MLKVAVTYCYPYRDNLLGGGTETDEYHVDALVKCFKKGDGEDTPPAPCTEDDEGQLLVLPVSKNAIAAMSSLKLVVQKVPAIC